jgi:hypothetical protein
VCVCVCVCVCMCVCVCVSVCVPDSIVRCRIFMRADSLNTACISAWGHKGGVYLRLHLRITTRTLHQQNGSPMKFCLCLSNLQLVLCFVHTTFVSVTMACVNIILHVIHEDTGRSPLAATGRSPLLLADHHYYWQITTTTGRSPLLLADHYCY